MGGASRACHNGDVVNMVAQLISICKIYRTDNASSIWSIQELSQLTPVPKADGPEFQEPAVQVRYFHPSVLLTPQADVQVSKVISRSQRSELVA